MAQPAIGILETKGLIPLICGTDAMLKAANVELVGPMKQVGSAMVSATVCGDVAAVRAALDAGAEAASSTGEVLSAHLIARPQEEAARLIPSAKPAPARKGS